MGEFLEKGVPAGVADKDTHTRERALCAKRAALWEWWHWSVSNLQGPKLTGNPVGCSCV